MIAIVEWLLINVNQKLRFVDFNQLLTCSIEAFFGQFLYLFLII